MRTPVIFTFLLLIHLPLVAQEKNQVALKEYFLDAEYFFAEEEYPDALTDYLELFNNGYAQNANINYRIGVCYLNMPGQKDKSIPYLLAAVKNTSRKYNETLQQKAAPVDAWLFLGNAYRVNNQLDKAVEAYNQYKALAGSSEALNYADQQIAACNTAVQFMSQPEKVKMTNLGDSVNGNSSNFKAVVSGDGKTLLYMNELPFYDAVYYSHYTSQGWSAPVNITPQIESDGDQYVSSVSFDGTQLYLTREDPFNSDIYVSHFDQNKWSKSMPVEGQDVNTKYWESHASISANGKTLYFTSNRKGGLGEMDIYKTSLQESGQWGPPVNLGASVNTALNDDTPFITDNDSLLFFSSQGHENMGGYDLFVSNLDSAGSWSEALNLRYPCSTTDDDLFYYPWHNGTVGYVSVIRPGGLGKEDIYAVQSESAPPLHEFLTAFFKSAEPVVVEQTLVKLPEQLSSVEETAAVPEPIQDKKSEDTVADMPPAAKNALRIIELAPVYFTFDNFQLNPEGTKQLNEIYKLLQEFPNLKVQITGHADAKGPESYNLLLSVKRAEAVVKYLTDKGIARGRFTIQGMGKKNFAAINTYADGSDCPEGRRLNRRVDYKVIEPEQEVVIIKFPPIPEQLRPQ